MRLKRRITKVLAYMLSELISTLMGMFYGVQDRKLYRKIKSAMPFLSYKQITFFIGSCNVILILLPIIVLYLMFRFVTSQQFVDLVTR